MTKKKNDENVSPHAAKDTFAAFPQFHKDKHEVVDRSMMDVQHTGKSTQHTHASVAQKTTPTYRTG